MGRAFEYRKKSKEARWGHMSKIFPKLGKIITMAAKEGGSDPESNSKLRTAIINAKAENMPKDNIDAAIKRASGKDAVDMVEINYEGKGPHGTQIYVECATDNTNRTVTNVKMAFNKNGGEVLQTGALQFLFARKAIIEFELSDHDPEEIELELIDAGLEELEVDADEGLAIATGDYTAFSTLSQKVEELGLELKAANLQRIPNNTIELTDEQQADLDKIVEKLEDDEDVQAVYTNVS